MKKIAILSVMVLLLCSNFIHAQVKGKADYTVKYKAEFSLDSTNLDQRSNETHYLYTGSDVSYYASMAMIRIDSLMQEMDAVPEGNRAERMRKAKKMREDSKNRDIPGFLPEVYKDFSKEKVWVASRIQQDQFIYPEPNVPLNWEMTDSTKTIGKREAHKATVHFGGRDWVAWFTFEVPIPDGPYVFSGLPGLILELYDTRDDYHFNVISIEKLEQPFQVDSESRGYKEITKEKFIKAYKNFRKAPLGEYESMIRDLDIKIPDPTTGERVSPSEFIRRAKKLIAGRNNYIERW